ARLLHTGERGERAGRHRAVRSERGPVQIGGDESRSAHSTFQSALLAVNVQFCTINWVTVRSAVRRAARRRMPRATGRRPAERTTPATPCTPPARAGPRGQVLGGAAREIGRAHV